jgi:hypothetical protein
MDYAVAPSAFLHPAAMISSFTAQKSRPRCVSEEQSLAIESAVKNLHFVYFRNYPAIRFSVPAALLPSLQECPCR